jgi:uncharacterized protein
VILDASWSSSRQRAAAAAVAEKASADLVQLRCTAPPALAAQRIRTRSGDASDADPAIAAQMAAASDPWPEAITIDTSGGPGSGEPVKALQQALDAIRPLQAKPRQNREDTWRAAF